MEKTLDCQTTDFLDGSDVADWFDNVGILYRICSYGGYDLYTIYELPAGWSIEEIDGYLKILNKEECVVAKIDTFDLSISIQDDW